MQVVLFVKHKIDVITIHVVVVQIVVLSVERAWHRMNSRSTEKNNLNYNVFVLIVA